MAVQTSASHVPALPPVYSTTVSPGLSRPSSSGLPPRVSARGRTPSKAAQVTRPESLPRRERYAESQAIPSACSIARGDDVHSRRIRPCRAWFTNPRVQSLPTRAVCVATAVAPGGQGCHEGRSLPLPEPKAVSKPVLPRDATGPTVEGPAAAPTEGWQGQGRAGHAGPVSVSVAAFAVRFGASSPVDLAAGWTSSRATLGRVQHQA